MSRNKKDEKVVEEGFLWRRLEGSDQRDVWDPQDKKKFIGCLWTWAFLGVCGFLLGLLPTLDYTRPLDRAYAVLAVLISVPVLFMIYPRTRR